jgi:sugar phosphate isomerase/epimerase
MKLGLNTFCYEVAQWPVERQIDSAARLGFRYVEYAAYRLGDPTGWTVERRRETVRRFKDAGLRCSQMLLTNVEHMASSEPALRREALEYMKRVGEFQLELGGRQVLVCWGCGVLERGCLHEQSWATMVAALREYAEWALPRGILIDLELDPHVYFIVNSTVKMAKVVEDVGMENVFPNVDIGHLEITREGPACLEKLRGRIIHVHLSETDTYAHTNSILGEGKADFRVYVDKVMALGIEENCARLDEPCVAGIEMGEPGGEVDDPERWVRKSLAYLSGVVPELTR